MKSIKLHLADSEEPLTEYTDIVPLCELGKPEPKPVERAFFELRFTEDVCRDVEDMLDNVRGLCRECRQLVLEGRYIYGIRPAAEVCDENRDQRAAS